MFFKKRLKSFIVIILIVMMTMMFMLVGTGANEDTKTQNEDEVLLPIIMYHSFLKDPNLQNDYNVSPDLFEQDLKYLDDNGYTTVTVSDLVDYVYSDKELPDKCVMLTFDDGYYNNYYYAYPLLKKYKCKAVLSPIISMTEQYTASGGISITYGSLGVSEIKEMLDSGHVEIQNHSYDMHNLTPRRGVEQKTGEKSDVYETVVTEDLTKAQEYIKTNFDVTPVCFVYPFGAKSDPTPEIIKNLGFICTMTCTEEPNVITKNPESLYELGRYRRDRNESMETLMKRVGNIKK